MNLSISAELLGINSTDVLRLKVEFGVDPAEFPGGKALCVCSSSRLHAGVCNLGSAHIYGNLSVICCIVILT